MTDTHSAQCLEGGFQYVPWSRSLHNIIKQFKLVLLMQALRGGGGSLPSFPSLPTTPPACALSALHPPHSSVSLLSICGLIRRGEKKVFFEMPCQGLPGGIGLLHSFLLPLACQPLRYLSQGKRGSSYGRVNTQTAGSIPFDYCAIWII